MDADAEWQSIGSNLAELKLDGIFDATESRICAAFGVPPILVGARLGIMKSTYSNYEQARQSFWEETLLPRCQLIGDVLTGALAEEWGEDIRIRFKCEEVDALQESEETKRTWAVQGWESGLLTKNEARGVAGMDPVEGDDGDEFKTEPEPDENESRDNEDNKWVPIDHEIASRFADDEPEGEDLEEWQEIHAAADAGIDKFEAALLAAFGVVLSAAVLADMREQLLARSVDGAADAVPWTELSNTLRNELRAPLRSLVEDGAVVGRRHLSEAVKKKFFLRVPKLRLGAGVAATRLAEHLTEQGKKAVRRTVLSLAFDPDNVDEALQELAASIPLTESQVLARQKLREDLSGKELSSVEIQQELSAFDTTTRARRALLIARTETVAAVTLGQRLAWEQAIDEGLIDRESSRLVWVVTPDDRLDEKQCAPMSGQQIEFDEQFTTGDGHLVDGPPVHPGCRCAVRLATGVSDE